MQHSVQRDVENSLALVFYEEWESMAALKAHFQVPESGQFVAALTAMLREEPEMKIYEASLEQ
jgi:quinol monooxygenase YgiN